mgnify:FL=1
MTFTSATVENVGRYFCVFNESIREDHETDYEYEDQVKNYEASSIYVFVNGKILRHTQFQNFYVIFTLRSRKSVIRTKRTNNFRESI